MSSCKKEELRAVRWGNRFQACLCGNTVENSESAQGVTLKSHSELEWL